MPLIHHGLYLPGLLGMLMSLTVQAADSFTGEEPVPMEIVFEVEGEPITATLEETAAARAFAGMLPLTLELTDFGGGTEKVADLPGKLPTQEAPEGIKPVAGDITYYAPWGNLALFRKDFHHSKGLIRLGHFTSDYSALDRSGPVPVILRREE